MRSGCDGEYSCFQDDDRSEERVAAFRIVLSTLAVTSCRDIKYSASLCVYVFYSECTALVLTSVLRSGWDGEYSYCGDEESN